MKKVLGLALSVLMIFSLTISAATLVDGTLTVNNGTVVITKAEGFNVEVSNVEGKADIIKAKVSLVGPINLVTSIKASLVYDNTKLALLDATATNELTGKTVSTTPESEKDDFAKELGDIASLRKGGNFTTKNAGYQTETSGNASTGNVQFAFDRLNATVEPCTFNTMDWYEVYFRVKTGSVTNENLDTYLWTPKATGYAQSVITFYATHDSETEAITLTSVPGTNTAKKFCGANIVNVTPNFVSNIPVTDLTVAKDTVNLKMGATTEETVGVTIVPDNATDKTYSVESSASGVATAEVVAGGVKITAVSDGTANVTVTSNDNASAKKVIAVNVAKADPTNYTVTVDKTGLGIATVSAGTVAAGGTVDLRVLPVLGNKVSSITMNSQDITADFNAFLGGKKTYTIKEDTTFTVAFASIIGTEAEKPFVAPDAFVGEYTKPGTTGAQKSAAAFGKISAPVASNLVTEYGVKLLKDGAPYTKEVGGVTYGPKFEATSNVNDQFGVLFIGLEAGTYTATTYVVYDNGGTPTEVEGYAVTFTVQ